MWALYGWLLAKGVEVYMNRRPTGDVIAIYPEIQAGNPVNTNKVVRYVLNKPGLMGGYDIYGRFSPGPSMFDESEKIYYFSRLFGEAASENHYMFLPAINLHIFKDQKKTRNKSCYLIGKGTNKAQHPHGSIELNRNIAKDQGQLASLLNECHTFYCYDDLTAMMEVARLCGVRVRYYGNYEREELEKYEPGLNGISIGTEDNRKLKTEEFRDHYVSMVKLFEKRLEDFIDETQQW